jgi:hypothetical protein
MSTYEFTISLHIRHPTIDPLTITQALGLEPQYMWQRGDARRGPTGAPLEGVYRESYWTARMTQEPQLSSGVVSVESYLMQTVSVLQRSQVFLEQLNDDGGIAELHVSLFARGDFRLDLISESLALIGRFRLAIVLDVHLHAIDQPSPPPTN